MRINAPDQGYREHPASVARRERRATLLTVGGGEKRKRKEQERKSKPAKRRPVSQLREGKLLAACDRCGGAFYQRKKVGDGYCCDECRFAVRIEGGHDMTETDTEKTWTPRTCVDCGLVFYAIAGWVCDDCQLERAAHRAEWKDPDSYFDEENPGYKIYRIRYWVAGVPDLSLPYDYHGRTGNIKIRDRIRGEYSFKKRFPELHKQGVAVDEEVDIIRSFPWSADGRDRAIVAEMIAILESAIDTETITMNTQLVPEFTRSRNWKTIEAARRQLARQELG